MDFRKGKELHSRWGGWQFPCTFVGRGCSSKPYMSSDWCPGMHVQVSSKSRLKSLSSAEPISLLVRKLMLASPPSGWMYTPIQVDLNFPAFFSSSNCLLPTTPWNNENNSDGGLVWKDIIKSIGAYVNENLNLDVDSSLFRS
jgi:hypothetical protein